MPLVSESTFRPTFGLGNGHLQTVWPVLFPSVPLITTQRKRLELADGDFIDLDWARQPETEKLVILTHGLESHARDPTVQAMARVFSENGYDVLAWNLRGCSGEPNRLLRFYHSGATEDLAAVVDAVVPYYTNIALVGFSLGGNITLKYLGETPCSRITAAVAFSAPCDLTSSVDRLDGSNNQIYTRRFVSKLRAKIFAKKLLFPDQLDVSNLEKMRTFHEFDAAYTAPLHGFVSAEDYWFRASSLRVLEKISVPTLLVNAANDPFLAPACFPREIANNSEYFYLEIPSSGGHCGFVGSPQWQQLRALQFIKAAGR